MADATEASSAAEDISTKMASASSPGDKATRQSSQYYYWHGHEKERAEVGDVAPQLPPMLLKTEAVQVAPAPKTRAIQTYSWCSNDKSVSVYINHPGIGALPKEDVSVEFGKQAFEVAITTGDSTRHVLALRLAKEIAPETSTFRQKPDQLVIRLAKAKESETWWDLICTKTNAEDDE